MPIAEPLRALFLVPATFDELQAKGVADKILERDEDGFFDRVYTVHFPVTTSRVLSLSPRHTVIEIGPEPFGRLKRPRLLHHGLYLLKVLTVLVRLVRRERIAFIRANEPSLRGLIAWLLGRMTRVPWCVSLHADYDACFESAGALEAPVIFGSRSLARRLERFVISRAPLVLIVREYLRDYIRRLGATPHRIGVIPHGVDFAPWLRPPDQTFAQQHGVAGKALVVSVVRLSREKYVHDIPTIAALVVERRQDAVFVVLGDGRERPALERAIQELGLEGRMILLGFQPQATVAEFQRNADVNLCLHGGYSLIEAAGSGRPVASYDLDWQAELIRNGETGFLVETGDVHAAASAVIALLESSALAARLGSAARALALRVHSPEASRAAKIACYQELLRKPARA